MYVSVYAYVCVGACLGDCTVNVSAQGSRPTVAAIFYLWHDEYVDWINLRNVLCTRGMQQKQVVLQSKTHNRGPFSNEGILRVNRERYLYLNCHLSFTYHCLRANECPLNPLTCKMKRSDDVMSVSEGKKVEGRKWEENRWGNTPPLALRSGSVSPRCSSFW